MAGGPGARRPSVCPQACEQMQRRADPGQDARPCVCTAAATAGSALVIHILDFIFARKGKAVQSIVV